MNTEQLIAVTSDEPTIAPPSIGEIPRIRRSRNKIARYPIVVRARINRMLEEGGTYAEIVATLKDEAPDLNEPALSRWYQSGHQAWLAHQTWVENARDSLDFAASVVTEHNGAQVHQANLHVAATHLIENLRKSGEILLEENPQAYLNLVNSISKISHEALNFQRYREACAEAREQVAKLRDVHRKLSDAEKLAIVDKLDEILGFK